MLKSQLIVLWVFPVQQLFAFLFLLLIFLLYFIFCHFTYNVSCCRLLWLVGESCSVVSNSLQPHGLYSPWNSLGQNTGVGSLFLLQGILPAQGLNPGPLHCRWILYQVNHKGRFSSFPCLSFVFKNCRSRGFLGGPVVKNLPCNAGDTGSISGPGTRIPHALEQLSR